MKKIAILISTVLIVLVGCNQPNLKTETTDSVISLNQLPSWKDGPTKSAIIQFVNEVIQEGGLNYVQPEKRIATFDQDGTLWCEQPVAQLEFVVYQIKKMADEHPEWENRLPYKAILEGDKNYLINDYVNNHGAGLMKLVVATHTGMSIENFNMEVKEFFNASRHPKFNKKYTETIYLPMLELLQYLRANDFKTYICSGGGNDFMRVIAEDTYGIVPENVIGSFAMNTFKQVDGSWKIVKDDKNLFMNDKETKPAAIEQRIGRIPIFVAGNVRSGGDIGQLTYSKANPLPNFQLLINHDDDKREFAYAEKDNASLNAAKEGDWHVVSMKNDWLKIFPFDN
jgi:phosphoserine phosphatase